MKNLSIAIAVHNEEANLRMSLPAVAGWADEIIVVDGASSDGTVAVARKFGAKVIETDNPPIFHINKQKALDASSGKWIFQLDADEVVTPELKKEIEAIMASKEPEFAGYYVPRKNFFLSHWMRKGGQYPDYVIRFFLRKKGSFPTQSVHEQISIDGNVGYLKNDLLHYSYRSLSEYMVKANRYSTLVAKKLAENKTPKNIFSYIQYNIFSPTQTFLNLFIRHKGFMDGVYGFVYAVLSGMQHAMAYQKYLKLNNA